jgi:hypothetical protein
VFFPRDSDPHAPTNCFSDFLKIILVHSNQQGYARKKILCVPPKIKGKWQELAGRTDER